MIHIISSIMVGFFIVVLSRALGPGVQVYGFLITALFVVAGAFAGGLLGRMLAEPTDTKAFHPPGFLLSIGGAAVPLAVLALWR